MARPAEPSPDVEVVLDLRRTAQGRAVVGVRTTRPALDYGTVELLELPLLLEAVLVDVAGGEDDPSGEPSTWELRPCAGPPDVS